MDSSLVQSVWLQNERGGVTEPSMTPLEVFQALSLCLERFGCFRDSFSLCGLDRPAIGADEKDVLEALAIILIITFGSVS